MMAKPFRLTIAKLLEIGANPNWLAAIPVTVDDVVITIGMTVWFYEPNIGVQCQIVDYVRTIDGAFWVYLDGGAMAATCDELFSTRDMAALSQERVGAA